MRLIKIMEENIIKETESLLAQRAYEIVNRVIDTSELRLFLDDKEDVSLFAPRYFITLLEKHFETYCQVLTYTKTTNQMFFRGYEIRLHPYNEVVLAHLDYGRYLNEDLINKIKL